MIRVDVGFYVTMLRYRLLCGTVFHAIRNCPAYPSSRSRTGESHKRAALVLSWYRKFFRIYEPCPFLYGNRTVSQKIWLQNGLETDRGI